MAKLKAAPASSALFDRARLLILTNLIGAKGQMAFNELLAATGLTKGNLGSHLGKLEKLKLIKISKRFVERKPLTTIVLTDTGRNEFKSHVADLERIIKSTGGLS